jgi:hypothetical protein
MTRSGPAEQTRQPGNVAAQVGNTIIRFIRLPPGVEDPLRGAPARPEPSPEHTYGCVDWFDYGCQPQNSGGGKRP